MTTSRSIGVAGWSACRPSQPPASASACGLSSASVYRLLLALTCVFYAESAVAADDVLSVIPATAEAFSVVRNMEDFSGKIDHVAVMMGRSKPDVLEAAMSDSLIRRGLDQTGSIGWVTSRAGRLYFLPTTDFRDCISRLEPRRRKAEKEHEVFDVTIAGSPALAAPIDDYAAFELANEPSALRDALEPGPAIVDTVRPLAPWLESHDAYMVVTEAGLASGLRDFELPLSGGNAQLGMLFRWAKSQLSSLNEATEAGLLALGLSIDEERGATMSVATVLKKESDLRTLLQNAIGHRDQCLHALPGDNLIFAMGGSLLPRHREQLVEGARALLDHRAATEILSDAEATRLDNLKERLSLSAHAAQFAFYSPFGTDAPSDVAKEQMPARIAKSFVLVIKTNDAHEALSSVQAWLQDFAKDFDWLERIPEEPADADSDLDLEGSLELPEGLSGLTFLACPTERSEFEGHSVLRPVMRETKPQHSHQLIELMVAAADDTTLIITFGGDEELKRALRAFSNDPTSLVRQPEIRRALEMLPKQAQWVALLNGHHALELLRHEVFVEHISLINLLPPLPESAPLAASLTWQDPVMRTTLAAPTSLLKASKGIAGLVGFF